jgi:hypothetical protein
MEMENVILNYKIPWGGEFNVALSRMVELVKSGLSVTAAKRQSAPERLRGNAGWATLVKFSVNKFGNTYAGQSAYLVAAVRDCDNLIDIMARYDVTLKQAYRIQEICKARYNRATQTIKDNLTECITEYNRLYAEYYAQPRGAQRRAHWQALKNEYQAKIYDRYKINLYGIWSTMTQCPCSLADRFAGPENQRPRYICRALIILAVYNVTETGAGIRYFENGYTIVEGDYRAAMWEEQRSK